MINKADINGCVFSLKEIRPALEELGYKFELREHLVSKEGNPDGEYRTVYETNYFVSKDGYTPQPWHQVAKSLFGQFISKPTLSDIVKHIKAGTAENLHIPAQEFFRNYGSLDHDYSAKLITLPPRTVDPVQAQNMYHHEVLSEILQKIQALIYPPPPKDAA